MTSFEPDELEKRRLGIITILKTRRKKCSHRSKFLGLLTSYRNSLQLQSQ